MMVNRKALTRRTILAGLGLAAAATGVAGPAAAFPARLASPAPRRSGTSAMLIASGDIAAGLKEALRVGTEKVVAQLGTDGGFLNDPAVHIPLPPGLEQVQTALGTVGMASLADEVEVKLNEAAEAATPKAEAIFMEAINAMTVEDATGILNGPDDAATQYFREAMSPSLKEEMRPVVDASLNEVGAVQAYDAMIAEYETIPFMPDAKAELTDYGLEQTLDGIFYYVAEQERAIRANPAARTTDLLKQVFGG